MACIHAIGFYVGQHHIRFQCIVKQLNEGHAVACPLSITFSHIIPKGGHATAYPYKIHVKNWIGELCHSILTPMYGKTLTSRR